MALKKKPNIKDLQKENVNLKRQLEEINDKFIRSLAEFDNYKKFNEKEMVEFKQFEGGDVLLDLLPVLDDFDRALTEAKNDHDNPAVIGMTLIHKKLKDVVESKGLKEMEVVGEAFDTDKHEAITKIKASSKHMKDKVVEQIEKGYYLNERIIRYAKVIVGE